MNTTQRTRPETLEQALRALDEAEAKLRAYDTDTAVMRLADSVKRSEERFRMLAEGVPNHLLFLDLQLRIVFANDVSPRSWAPNASCSGNRSTNVRSRARR